MKNSKVSKAKKAKSTAAPVTAPAPVTTNAPADKSAQGEVKIEATRTIVLGNGRKVEVPTGNAPAPVSAPPAIIPGLGNHDVLATTGGTWNSKFAEVHPEIKNRDAATFPFARFEYVTHRFPGSSWGIIRCSDNNLEVGVPFNVAKGSYYVMNNERLQTFIDVLQAGVEKEGLRLSIQTAGTLDVRNRQFVSFKIEGLDELEVGHRKINSFLSLLKGLDKQISFTFVNSTITVCCANTFQMVKDDTGAPLYGKIKFTKNCELKIAEVPLIVRSFVSGNEALIKKLKQWESIGMTPIQAEQLFATWLGDLDKPMSTRMNGIIARLKELHVIGKGNKGETALDAFNAVTDYYTHESAGETDNVSKQLESSEIGDGAEKKVQFFDFLAKSLESSAAFQGVCKMGETILVAYSAEQKRRAAAK